MRKIWYRIGEAAWYLTVRENGRQKQIRLLMAPNDKEGKRKAEQKAIEELASRADEAGPPAPVWAVSKMSSRRSSGILMPCIGRQPTRGTRPFSTRFR
jgi:hypothetical protein